MTAAENRRRLMVTGPTPAGKGKGPAALHNSAEVLHAVAMRKGERPGPGKPEYRGGWRSERLNTLHG